MSGNRLIDYLDHLLEAARLACSYVGGRHKGGFLADRRTQQAVILNIVIIGEAATQLAKEHQQEGRQEEALAILSKLLRRRFGKLPAWAVARLTQADAARLEAWAINL